MNRLCCSCPHWGASEETAWSLWDQKKMLRFVHVSDPSLSLLFLGKQEWRTRDVLADHSSCHFSPSFSKLLSPFCPTFAILCVLLLKHSSLGWESSQSSPYSLQLSSEGLFWKSWFLRVGGYIKMHLSQVDRQMRCLQRILDLPRQVCDCSHQASAVCSPLESL